MLYRRHGGTVFRYAWHLLGRREDAEDATQATFLAAHRALAGGTAVLEPGAWVLRIARNECMERLREIARRPEPRVGDDESAPLAAVGVEQTAELHSELHVARETLRGLPLPEREAFVLREWLGLGTGEAAVAMGVTAGEVDGLARRARRSLVLAVGGLEPAIGCAAARAELVAGSLDRAGKVHLLRCPVCRGVRRALRAPDAGTKARAAAAAVGGRLADAVPGFAAGGGGILAALTAKLAAAPMLAKTAAVVAAVLVTGGAVEQAIRTSHPLHRIAAPPAAAVPARGSQAHAVLPASTARRPPAPTAAPVLALPVPASARGGSARPARTDEAARGGEGSSVRGSDDGRAESESSVTGTGTGTGRTGDDRRSGESTGGGETAGDRNGSGPDKVFATTSGDVRGDGGSRAGGSDDGPSGQDAGGD